MVRAHLRSRIMTGTAGAVRLLGSLGLLRRPGLRQGHAKQVVPHPKARLRSLTGARSKAIVLKGVASPLHKTRWCNGITTNS